MNTTSEKRKREKKKLITLIGLCTLVLICALIILFPLASRILFGDNNSNTPHHISDDMDVRELESYTWEQYQELTPEEKAIFLDYFDSFEEYEKWYEDNEQVKE